MIIIGHGSYVFMLIFQVLGGKRGGGHGPGSGECSVDGNCVGKYPDNAGVVCDAGKCRKQCNADGTPTPCQLRADKPQPTFTCSSDGNLCVSKNFSITLSIDSIIIHTMQSIFFMGPVFIYGWGPGVKSGGC